MTALTLEQAEPFKSLFPVERETLELVKGSMREHGYQADKPILVWKDAFGERGRQVVVDGHTRLRAARDLKLPEVWATMRQFKDADAAVTAAVGEQVQRRNLNRQQLAAHVVAILPHLDETKGGLRTRTAKQLAAMLGVSVPTIDRARGVIASGDEELIAAVKDGSMSLLGAYSEVTAAAEPNPYPAAEHHLERAAEFIAVAESADPELEGAAMARGHLLAAQALPGASLQANVEEFKRLDQEIAENEKAIVAERVRQATELVKAADGIGQRVGSDDPEERAAIHELVDAIDSLVAKLHRLALDISIHHAHRPPGRLEDRAASVRCERRDPRAQHGQDGDLRGRRAPRERGTRCRAARRRLQDPRRLRHPLARERQAPAAVRLRDEDRGPRVVRRERRSRGSARGAPDPEITFDAFCELFLERHGADRRRADEARRSRSGSPRPASASARWTLRELEGAAGDIAAWRAGLTDTSRYRLTAALRQALGAAVRWRYIAREPRRRGGPQPAAARRGAAAVHARARSTRSPSSSAPSTGRSSSSPPRRGCARTSGSALERRDVDRAGRAVTVQRRYADGVLTPFPKTRAIAPPRAADRAGARALEALPPQARHAARCSRPPRAATSALDNWRTREWYDALDAAGIERRGPYHLRHTFATEALAAGVSIFELARAHGHVGRDDRPHLRAPRPRLRGRDPRPSRRAEAERRWR